MELFDSHAHYDDEKFNEDRDFIINEIYKSGVTKFVSAGYSLESSKIGIELAKKYDFIYTTSGISPNDIPATNDELESQLLEIEKIAKSNSKVVAIGEIGLDYYWNKDQKELQKYAFKKQIEIANNLNLPIVIHTRDAIMDTIEIIKNTEFVRPGIFHCCPLNADSPYLSPEPNRGKRNDSRNVIYMAKKIAEIKQMDIEEVAKVTYQNALNAFNIK